MKRLILALTLTGAIAVSATASAEGEATLAEPPLGLWSWSAVHSEDVQSIEIERIGNDWNASINDEPVEFVRNQHLISIATHDGSSFIGTLAEDGSEISGYWFQPAMPAQYQSVATPAVFHLVSNGKWKGDVTQQARPFNVFLDVFEEDDTTISAVMRNPEGNEIMGASRFRLVAKGDDVWTLVAGTGDRERRYDLQQTGQNALLLDYDPLQTSITLRPATDSSTAKYYSRSGGNAPRALAPQVGYDDGWEVTAPEDAGFDPAALEALTLSLSTADPRARRPQMIHSLLIARSGKLVFEEYFFGHDRETRHDVRSLGKVFGSVMVGAMQQQGYSIDATHRPIANLLGSAGQQIDDPRRAEITLAQLMTFTSGLDCDANSDSQGSESRMWEQQEEANYWLFTAQLPVVNAPGERYAYCSGSANLVGASLREFGGAPVYELFDRLIASPLEFGPYHWALAPDGEGYLGGGAYMRPRDILKVGAMYAADGVWNGEQVISQDWVKDSTTPKIAISAETTGMSPDEFSNNYVGGSQAYIWRVDSIAVGDQRYVSYEASGNGGQLLIIIPELDLTVGFTGGNYRMGGIWGRWRDQIIGNHIIPAMIDLPIPPPLTHP